VSQAIIGVITIEQDTSFFAGRYFREILTVASQEIAGHACYLRIISLTDDQISTAEAARRALGAHHIDAALLVAPSESFLASTSALLHTLPSIIISAPPLDIPLNYVNSDNYGVLRLVVAHLAGLGRRRIRLLQPDGGGGDFPERMRGYTDEIDTLGLEPQIGMLSYPISNAMMDQQVLIGAPDALIAADDHDALALLSRLQRRGLRVPRDIALVGFDDEDFAADTFPALTTVGQPLGEMARHATRYLLDRLSGVERGLYQEILPNHLIVRESCGARLL
jgi:DNA-binding LacI/PurR family transcriptional regulator